MDTWELLQLNPSNLMDSVFTTTQETYGNGVRIGSTEIFITTVLVWIQKVRYQAQKKF